MVNYYLNADITKICDAHAWKHYSHQEISVSTQVLLRYNLLDQLANAVGYPQAKGREMVRAREGILMPKKLKQV